MKRREYCGFCGKHEKDVERLIEGPETAVCNECIVLMNDMLSEPARAPIPINDLFRARLRRDGDSQS